MRELLNINKNWFFCKEKKVVDNLKDFVAHEWEKTDLPHTYNAVDGQDGGNDYYRGVVSYLHIINITNEYENRKKFIEINGASNIADVFINGEKAGHHEGGFSTFRVDITSQLKPGDNIMVITVDNSENDFCYPQVADFSFYGGIYRDVNLIITDSTHFELEKNGTPAIKITPVLSDDLGKANVSVELWSNGGEKISVHIAENTVEVPVTDGYAKAEVFIDNVHLWNGKDDPYCYEATAELINNGVTVDWVKSRFGCRKITFDKEKGFLLNNREYPLRGVSRHQDRAGIGNALTLKEHEEDMNLILEIGANTVRLAHYQHSQDFYDLCDEKGIVVWAEIPYITKHMPAGRQNTLDQMTDLITQCYNHPSVVCWGLSNEITASGMVDDDLLENHRILNELCHKIDATRPTVMAHAFMLETDSPLIEMADIASYNLYFGWYLGELKENEEFFDAYHSKYPDRIIGFSEYGADANPRFHSSKPEKGDYTEEYQCLYHEHILDVIEKRPYLWATHLWNMFDFAADGRDEGGEHGKNQKGLVTIDRKTKKDAFFLYKAHWNKSDIFVHICGRRYEDRAEECTVVKVYSNASEVELFKDGESLGSKTGVCQFEFKVPVSGEHEIKAVACPEGKTVSDVITIKKVDKPNPDYKFAKAESGVSNWFDQAGIKEGFYSLKDTFGDLMANPKAQPLVGAAMAKAIASRGDVAKNTEGNKALQAMIAKMPFDTLLKQAKDAFSSEEIIELNVKLQAIEKTTLSKLDIDLETHLDVLFAHEESRAVFDKILPGMREKVASQPGIMSFPLSRLIAYSKGAIPEAAVKALEDALSKLEIYVDDLEKYSESTPKVVEGPNPEKVCIRDSFTPGEVMYDTKGERIQAHGGAVLYDDGIYYLYGENKDRTDGKTSIWTWGIRAYKSVDLYNWEDLGLIIAPNLKDSKSCLFPERHVDRPHIIKNEKTGKYVCYIKQSGEEACFVILTADKFTGPYEIIKEGYRPDGVKVGDFDIVVSKDGKAYLYMDGNHDGVYGYELSDDYESIVRNVSVSYEKQFPPFTREGVACFEYKDKKYMLTSGMSGYIPNVSDAAVSDNWEEAFVSCGNPHVDDASKASFNSQISKIFRVEDKDNLFIAVADRWIPDFVVDARRANIIERSIASHYDKEKYQVTKEEQEEFMTMPMLENVNTSVADYIWLPLVVENGKPVIKWLDTWKLEEF